MCKNNLPYPNQWVFIQHLGEVQEHPIMQSKLKWPKLKQFADNRSVTFPSLCFHVPKWPAFVLPVILTRTVGNKSSKGFLMFLLKQTLNSKCIFCDDYSIADI